MSKTTSPRALYYRRRKPKMIKLFLAVIGVLIIGASAFAFFEGGKFSLASLLFGAAKNLVHPTTLQGESQGRTNVLIYGMTQDGMRTDSIILASYYWNQKKLVTLNVPRDLYVDDGFEKDKMGEVYSYAKQRQPSNSTYPDQYVAQVISKEYGIPINYWAEFNMQGEVDFVNSIGGIDVNVPDAFTDYQYPTANYSGYVRPAPHFNAGHQHMDGARALIFSRSRHSLDNNEGTDFARSKRQQLIIEAIMTKLKSMGVAGNLPQVTNYLGILGNNLTTNMSTTEMVSFAGTLKNISPTTDYVRANWATGNGFLCDSSTSSGEYITLYGTPSDCETAAGGDTDSQYRQLAIYFVQNLLNSAPQSPTDFVTTANQNLGYTASPSPTPANNSYNSSSTDTTSN